MKLSGLNILKVVYIYSEGVKGIDHPALKKFIHLNFGYLKVKLIKLKKEVVKTRGLLFDFVDTQKAFRQLKYAGTKDSCHIILTQKLFATIDEDKRPHIRAAIFGYPCVISTSGIVEGPAKPKEYYLYKQKYTQLGIWEIEEAKLKNKFQGRFIDYKDKRLPEVIKGYIAQGIFFYLIGESFCRNKSCRLFNSHWQEDLIYSQIKCSRFCQRHKRVLEKIKNSLKMA